MSRKELRPVDIDLGDFDLVHKETGEIIPTAILNTSDGGGFDKAFKHELANMLLSASTKRNVPLLVIAWILANKDNKNVFSCTYRSLSEELDCSLSSATDVLKNLTKAKYIKKIRNGVYMLTPEVSYYGSVGNLLKVRSMWKGE